MKLKPPNDDQVPRVGLAGLVLLLVVSVSALGVASFIFR